MTIPLKSSFYILALATLPCSAQWNDSFNDGDFRNNKSWKGDTSEFEINAEMKLQLNAPPVSGASCLVTESDVSTDATWKFWLQMDFNTSASNYAKIYLISNRAKIDSSVNGYYLRIGGTNDNISLFRQDGSTSTLLSEGRSGMLAASINKLAVQITRNLEGQWAISCDSTGQSDYSEIGQCRDTIYFNSKYFGIQCVYTATRSTHFLFDDFQVTGNRLSDAISPYIKEIVPLDDSLIRIEFSEPIDESSLVDVSHYNLSTRFTIKRLTALSDKTVEIHLTAPIPCGNRIDISVTNITDNFANSIRDTSLQITYCHGDANDILISEIMADPDPPVFLPNLEYLELYNSGGSELNLEQWNLYIGNDQITFPYLIIPPDSFLIITAKDGCKNFEKSLCTDILPGYLLNNTGEYVCLKNKKGKLINWVNYNEAFYHDELKKDGGWSLEMIDTDSPCIGEDNWKASSHYDGGTPGRSNSHRETVIDTKVFQYNHIHLPNDSTIRVHFSKPLNIEISPSTFIINPNNRAPKQIIIDSLQQLYVDIISPEIFEPNILYELQLSPEITDCAGEVLNDAATLNFSKPSPVDPKDIIINEILFDALPGSQEFVEIYNNSDKYINSNDVKFAYKSTSTAYESVNPIDNYPFLLRPQSFLVLTKNSENIVSNYSIPEKRLVMSTPDFPTLSNEEGCFALLSKNLVILDEFCYSANMHFSLIVNKTGVSLERTDYNKTTLDVGNWHSASSTEGYSTPGKVNSQYLDKNNTESGKEITLEHEIFSPNNDGYKDYETISYQFELSGYVANIIVFDALGRRVKILANNQLLGTSGSFTWDGINQDGHLASTGIYLIYIKIHHPSGEIKEYKKTCVLGGE